MKINNSLPDIVVRKTTVEDNKEAIYVFDTFTLETVLLRSETDLNSYFNTFIVSDRDNGVTRLKIPLIASDINFTVDDSKIKYGKGCGNKYSAVADSGILEIKITGDWYNFPKWLDKKVYKIEI